MSKGLALIRFYRTGNVYYGVYNGTVDMLYFNICTKEDCYDKKCLLYWLYDHLCLKNEDDFPTDAFSDLDDIDDVDIYTTYGGGFYWKGKGSESLKMVLEGLFPFNDYDHPVTDGKPDWTEKYLPVSH